MIRSFTLQDRHALVTGGTRGIGLAIAHGFLEAGARVTVCGRKQVGISAALGELSPFTDRVHGVPADVGCPEDLGRLVKEAEARFGPIDVLVNNAGTNPYFGPIVESDDAAWEKTFAVNLRGPYQLTRAVGAKMIEAGRGSVIHIASIAGMEAAPMMGIYSVTKAGLIMLTKVMAREWGRHGVRVNCICPGVVKTELSQSLWSDPERAKLFLARKALGRLGEPNELIGAALYFASDASSFTTGAVLQVDGGMVG
ncbi:MAG: SDR family NAD(P)-dependent oxidoreductase [Pirellulales bacterium]